MITFAKTRDMEAVWQILTHRKGYLQMKNDSAPAAADFWVNGEFFTAVLALDNGKAIGTFLLFPRDAESYEVHFCFLPAAWGRTAHVSEMFLEWFWRETEADRLLGPVPSYNRLALRLARSVGFRQYDVEVGCGTKHGVEFNRILTEIRRPNAA